MFANIIENIGKYNLPEDVQSDLIMEYVQEGELIWDKAYNAVKWSDMVKKKIDELSKDLWSRYEVDFIKYGTSKKDVSLLAKDTLLSVLTEIAVSVRDSLDENDE
jgi:hypothetical protein